MKKYAPYVILFLVVALIWNVFSYSHGTVVHIDGEEFDGPLGALFGLLFAGGGVLIGALVMLVVGAVLTVVFAGVGMIVFAALGVALFAVVAALSPLLLPLLVPVALVWFFVNRARRQRALREQAV